MFHRSRRWDMDLFASDVNTKEVFPGWTGKGVGDTGQKKETNAAKNK